MNERGIISSTTALFVMLILTISIATVKNIAARQADIVRYYRIENELQAAAESHFNEFVANLSKDSAYYGKLDIKGQLKEHKVTLKSSNEQANVTVYLKRSNTYKKILIMSLAELPNYSQNSSNIYKKVVGYMSLVPSSTTPDSDADISPEEENYEFTGYIY